MTQPWENLFVSALDFSFRTVRQIIESFPDPPAASFQEELEKAYTVYAREFDSMAQEMSAKIREAAALYEQAMARAHDIDSGEGGSAERKIRESAKNLQEATNLMWTIADEFDIGMKNGERVVREFIYKALDIVHRCREACE